MQEERFAKHKNGARTIRVTTVPPEKQKNCDGDVAFANFLENE